MTESARLKTSIPPEQHERFAELAAAQGVSVSKLLAKLVWSAVKESPDAKIRRLTASSTDDTVPAEKYTVRLLGADAARLEERAQARGLTASGYVAQVLRAHLRANPPMPYGEFQELKRVVNELAGIRGALAQIANGGGSAESLEASTRQTVMQLLPGLKRIRDDVQNMLDVNSKSWEAPDA
jgi:predicted HicB family RNase H-like nuclease